MEQEIIVSRENAEQEIGILQEGAEQAIIATNEGIEREIGIDEENFGDVLDYNLLANKPQINTVELIHNKSLEDLNIQEAGVCPDEYISNAEIEILINNAD